MSRLEDLGSLAVTEASARMVPAALEELAQHLMEQPEL